MIENRLDKIISNISEIPINSDSMNDVDIINDYNFDSVKMVQLIIDIETEFDICFEDDELEIDKLNTIEKLKKIIESKM